VPLYQPIERDLDQFAWQLPATYAATVVSQSFVLAAGIGGKGPFSGRDNDRWGGFYYLDISNTALLTRLKANNEVGGELFYSLGIIPALHATFDLQAVSSARPRQRPR
jgi:hypothetical protein